MAGATMARLAYAVRRGPPMKKHVEPRATALRPPADHGPAGMTVDETQIDWPAGLGPSADLAAMSWGGAPVAPSEAVSEAVRPSGVVVQVWRDALVLDGRKLTPTLSFDEGRLVRIEVLDLKTSELSTLAQGRASLGFKDEGTVAGTAGVTRWVVDLMDGRLSLEPDPELTDAGMI